MRASEDDQRSAGRSLQAVLLATSLFVSGVCAEAAETLPRLSGEVNYATYPGFAAYLFDHLEQPLALDITLPVDNEEADGHLTTFVLDGQFEAAYLAGPDGSKLYADNGFDLVDDRYYTLKGTFTVQPAGVHSGIPYLQLDPAEEPSGASFEEIAVATLKAPNG